VDLLIPILLAKRVGYVATNLIYGPVERLSTLVHSGIERFSDLNRRNHNNNPFNKYKRKQTNVYQHRSSQYEDDTEFDVNDDNKYEHEYNEYQS
jgi:hypothetical protein